MKNTLAIFVVAASIGGANAAVTCDNQGNCIATSPPVSAPPAPAAPALSYSRGAADCNLGYVTALDPYGDNFLSVRRDSHWVPSYGQDNEIDRLHMQDEVCIFGSVGRWLSVGYRKDGENRTGWVFDRYIYRAMR